MFNVKFYFNLETDIQDGILQQRDRQRLKPRDRERDGETKIERDRESNRGDMVLDTYRGVATERQKQTNREKVRDKVTDAYRQFDRESDLLKEKQTVRQSDRKREKE